jgi:hypothetical protein
MLKKLLCEAGDVLLTRMIRIRPGTSETIIALRSVVKLIFRLGPEYKDADIYVAAHHWAPALISRNYIGSKKNRPSRQFKCLLTRAEAISYDCSMEGRSNNFQACMQRAGVAIDKTDERRLLFVQGPTNTLSSVRSYFDGLTGDRAVRIRERISIEDQSYLGRLAVSVAVSSASPIVRQASPIATSPVAVSSASPIVRRASPIATSPDLILPESALQDYIRKRQQDKIGDSSQNRLHPKFISAFRILRTFYKNFDAIECTSVPIYYLYPCRGDPDDRHCLHYGVRHRRASTNIFCNYCATTELKGLRAERHHKKQKLDDTDGKRTATNSRISFTSLSPGEKDSRMANLARDRHTYRKNIYRLRKGISESKAKLKTTDLSSSLRSLIMTAFETMAKLDVNEKEEAKRHIISELVGLSIRKDGLHEGDGVDEIKEDEATKFAAYLTTEIDNKAKQLGGTPNLVEFTPAILQSAVVLYLRTKVGYKDQRRLSPLVMPCPSTIDRLLRDTPLNEGYSPLIYGHFFDEYVATNSPVMGQLVFDEMKLKTGVCWRTSDHTVCGFAGSNQNSTIRSVLSDMLNADESKVPQEFNDLSAPAVYVNQWRFRSIYNVIHNSNFFFNCGSLDGIRNSLGSGQETLEHT